MLANLSWGRNFITSKISDIEKAVLASRGEILFISDIGDVLYTVKDQALQNEHKIVLRNLEKEMEERIGKTEAEKRYSTILLTREERLVDDHMPSFIKRIQSNGIRVMALTNCAAGSFGDIKAIEDWALEKLERFGYSFKKSWPEISEKKFPELNSVKGPHSSLLFKNGVLFTASLPKGEALGTFLRSSGYKPTKVIFVDDKSENIKSVSEFCKKERIDFTGIEYNKVATIPHTPLNKKRITLQMEVLERENIWLPDTQADERLKG